jgi:hypothetical protein
MVGDKTAEDRLLENEDVEDAGDAGRGGVRGGPLLVSSSES